MSRKIQKNILYLVLAIIICCFASTNVIVTKANQKNDNETEEWMEIPITGRGIKIVNSDGAEIVLVDRLGGIYLNGDVYFNYEKYEKYENGISEKTHTSNFNFIIVYIMLILLFILHFVMLYKDNIWKGSQNEK